jgi:hypothetical protein
MMGPLDILDTWGSAFNFLTASLYAPFIIYRILSFSPIVAIFSNPSFSETSLLYSFLKWPLRKLPPRFLLPLGPRLKGLMAQ